MKPNERWRPSAVAEETEGMGSGAEAGMTIVEVVPPPSRVPPAASKTSVSSASAPRSAVHQRYMYARKQ